MQTFNPETIELANQTACTVEEAQGRIDSISCTLQAFRDHIEAITVALYSKTNRLIGAEPENETKGVQPNEEPSCAMDLLAYQIKELSISIEALQLEVKRYTESGL